MKILILCNKLPYPANDGSSIAMAKMIEGFVGEGENVSVLCLNTKKHFKNPSSIPKSIASKVNFNILEVDTTPSKTQAIGNLFQKLPFHVSRFYQPKVASLLVEILRHSEFDIVQIEGVFMMPYADLIRKNSRAKIVLRSHNVEHKIWQRTILNEKNWLLKSYLKIQTAKLARYENSCAKQADAVVAISENDENYFANFAKNHIAIPCGIDTTEAIKNINNQHFFHLGGMDWLPNQQGIDWLLEKVWPLVYTANPRLQLHLAGRGMKENLRQLKSPGVVIHGEVENAKDFREKHGIMLVPLLAGSGIRIKIIEGLAEGIPIISTSIGAEGISAKHNSEIVFANSAADFSSAILTLANNAELCATIGKNAAILAEQNFLNKILAKRLLAFYRSTWQISS